MSDKGKEDEEDLSLSSSLDVEVDPYASLVGGAAGAFSVPDDADDDVGGQDSPTKKHKGAPMTTDEILLALSGGANAPSAAESSTTDSGLLIRPNAVMDATGVEQQSAALLSRMLSRVRADDKRDGAHVIGSEGKGAGPCGKLHWFEGREVDYCFKLAGRYIGFNKNDNTLTLADDFIEKHNLMSDQTSVSQLRNEITSVIRSAIAQTSHEHAEQDLVDLVDNAKIVDPFQDSFSDGYSDGVILKPHAGKSGMATVTNPRTGKTEHVIYRNQADEIKIDEQKKRQAQAIAQAQKEQDARRAEIMARFKAQHAETKNRSAVLPQSAQTAASKPRKSIPTQSSRGMATLDSMGRVRAVPREKWLDLEYGYSRLVALNDDNQKLKEEMLASGFVMTEIAEYFRKLQLFIIMKNVGGGSDDALQPGDSALLAGASSAVKTPVKAFGGQGYSMQQPEEEQESLVLGDTDLFPEAIEEEEEEEQGKLIEVDVAVKVTKIQVRTLTGQRVVITCNVTTTVRHIRQHLIALLGRPDSGSFQLMQQRPMKILTDFSQTIESAQLQGGALMMKSVPRKKKQIGNPMPGSSFD